MSLMEGAGVKGRARDEMMIPTGSQLRLFVVVAAGRENSCALRSACNAISTISASFLCV